MDWIKTHYDRFLLIAAAIVLAAVSALLLVQGLSFKKGLEEGAGAVVRSRKLPTLDVSVYDQSSQQLQKPFAWAAHKNPIFVAEKHLVKDNRLVNPIKEDGMLIHPPVPNNWFDENGLDLLDPNILAQDPDKDGFSNLEEFSGKTDPQSAQSHPEYITKLRLKNVIRKPFRFVFKSWYGNPEQPESLNFQIETIDLKQPTQFVKMDGEVKGTGFKVLKFEVKSTTDSNQIRKDVSELSLQNAQGQLVVLPLEKVGDFPSIFARFKFLWNGSEFVVKNNGEFSLEPVSDKKYKLIDTSSTQALVLDVSGGQSIAIPLLDETAQ